MRFKIATRLRELYQASLHPPKREEVTLPLKAVSPADLRQNLGLGGQVNWIDRKATLVEELRHFKRLVITGGAQSGKTREAIELMRRAVEAGLVSPERLYQPGATFSFLDSLSLHEALLRGGQSNAPILLFLDDLPHYQSLRDLARFRSGLEALNHCEAVYVVVTACDDQLDEELLTWLDEQNFHRMHLPELSKAQTARLVDAASGVFGVLFDNDAYAALKRLSDGRPETTLAALRLWRYGQVQHPDRQQTDSLKEQSLAQLWAEALRQVIARQPGAEFILRALAGLRQSGVRPHTRITLAFAARLWRVKKRWAAPFSRTIRLVNALHELSQLDLVRRHGLLTCPNPLLDDLPEPPDIKLVDQFLNAHWRFFRQPVLKFIIPRREQLGWALFDLAMTFQHRKVYLDAARFYSSAIKVHARACHFYQRGFSHFELTNLTAARADFSAAIADDSQHAQAFNNRGVVNDLLNDSQAALADFTQAVSLDPRYAQAYYNRGNTRARLQDYLGALADYTQAIELDPKPATYNNRASIRAKLRYFEQALDDYTKAIEYEPKDAQAIYNRGLVYAEMQDLDSALEDYRRAHRLNPRDGKITYSIACLYGLQNDAGQAVHWLKQALKLDRTLIDIARTDTDFDNVRKDPDIQDIMAI